MLYKSPQHLFSKRGIHWKARRAKYSNATGLFLPGWKKQKGVLQAFLWGAKMLSPFEKGKREDVVPI